MKGSFPPILFILIRLQPHLSPQTADTSGSFSESNQKQMLKIIVGGYGGVVVPWLAIHQKSSSVKRYYIRISYGTW